MSFSIYEEDDDHGRAVFFRPDSHAWIGSIGIDIPGKSNQPLFVEISCVGAADDEFRARKIRELNGLKTLHDPRHRAKSERCADRTERQDVQTGACTLRAEPDSGIEAILQHAHVPEDMREAIMGRLKALWQERGR